MRVGPIESRQLGLDLAASSCSLLRTASKLMANEHGERLGRTPMPLMT